MIDWLFLGAASLIAILGIPTKHKHIMAILFVEFLIMTGYQGLVLSNDFDTYEEMAPFYMYKYAIQAGFAMIYLYFIDDKSVRYTAISLFSVSLLIMGTLAYSVFVSLYGIDSYYYQPIMVILAIIQLIIGFGGTIGYYLHIYDSSSHSNHLSGHKGA